MMKKNIFLTALCWLFFAQTLQPIVGRILRTIPKRPTPLFSPKQNIIGTLAGFLQETTLGDRIFLATTFLTHKTIVPPLIDAAEKGAHVSVIVDNASASTRQTSCQTHEILSELKEHGVQTHIFNPSEDKKNVNGYPIQMHLKTLFWQHHQDGQPLHRVASGSANCSKSSEKNIEFNMFYPNNSNLFNFYQNLFQHTASDRLPIFAPVPEKPYSEFIINSPNITIADVIKRALHAACLGESIKISTYTFNSWDITIALIECRKKGVPISLIVDNINKKDLRSQQQLSLLARSGISVFYPAGSKVNHAKYMLIKGKKNWDVIEGSGNLTYTADWDVNQLTIHPNNRKLFRYLEKNFDEIAQACLSD